MLLYAVTAALADTSVTVGNLRVQALSSKLIRVEPKGPMGFEDRSTFTVGGDRNAFKGIAITKSNETADGTWLKTDAYSILIKPRPAPMPGPTCASAGQTGTDVVNPARSSKFSGGYKATDRTDCCAACESDTSCVAYVFNTGTSVPLTLTGRAHSLADVPDANCWPISAYSSTVKAANRVFGCSSRGCTAVSTPPVLVPDTNGNTLYDSEAAKYRADSVPKNLLHWPSPSANSPAYALVDYPRFYAPEWGAMPIPAGTTVDPALKDTNGYDFRNNVNGDTYIFLLQNTHTTNSAKPGLNREVVKACSDPDAATWRSSATGSSRQKEPTQKRRNITRPKKTQP